jgi:DNA-directed RNA polymerase specialized sigma24 family protein
MSVTESARARTDQDNDAFALELITRAIRDSDQAAWSHLVERYRGLVLAQVRRTPSLIHAENEEYWVHRAFQRFWFAVSADRLPQFTTSRAVLKYLSLCAHSVVMDELRSRKRSRCEGWTETAEETPAGGLHQNVAFDQVMAGELWEVVADELLDESERLVAYLSLVRDMKPSQIAERLPERFRSVDEVYAIKRNALDRLRRSARVRQYVT